MHPYRIALRSIARRPAFAVTVVLSLTFGIGVTTTMFSIVNTVLLEPLPFPDSDRLVTVMEANPAKNQQTSLIAPGRLEDWNAENGTFTSVSGSYAENVTDTSGREPERLAGRRVAPRYFAVYGTAAQLGRTFTADEERFGGSASVVISDRLWTRRYARDPAVLRQRLVLGGVGYSIIGIMPAAFTDAPIDVWLPSQTPPGLLRVREARFLSGVGRMRRGVTIAQAAADLQHVQQTLGERYPASDKGWSVSVGDMKDGRVGNYREALWVVFGAVGLLLAIAVANVAGLMLVQLHRRASELSIRQAIGGSRRQIVSAVMREVLLIAGAGLIGGSVMSLGLERIVPRVFATVPRMNELGLDWRALAFTISATVAAALVFGLWPALEATRHQRTSLIASCQCARLGRRPSSAAGSDRGADRTWDPPDRIGGAHAAHGTTTSRASTEASTPTTRSRFTSAPPGERIALASVSCRSACSPSCGNSPSVVEAGLTNFLRRLARRCGTRSRSRALRQPTTAEKSMWGSGRWTLAICARSRSRSSPAHGVRRCTPTSRRSRRRW